MHSIISQSTEGKNNMNINMASPRKNEKVMFDQLPGYKQEQIKHLLLQNDFRAAKKLYDKFSKQSEGL